MTTPHKLYHDIGRAIMPLKTYYMIRFNGNVEENHTITEPRTVAVYTSPQGVRAWIKRQSGQFNVHMYTVFRCYPKFEGQYYDIEDFERDESDQGTPLTKYLPK